jgi:hypothetical protein
VGQDNTVMKSLKGFRHSLRMWIGLSPDVNSSEQKDIQQHTPSAEVEQSEITATNKQQLRASAGSYGMKMEQYFDLNEPTWRYQSSTK